MLVPVSLASKAEMLKDNKFPSGSFYICMQIFWCDDVLHTPGSNS